MASDGSINTGIFQTEIQQASETPSVIQEEGQFLDDSLENKLKIEDLKTKRSYNETLQQNNKERKKYAKHIFTLTCLWAILIFVILFFQGFKLTSLSDTVLVTLITSTTLNFFGFFLLVIKYLFNTETKKTDPPKKRTRNSVS